MKVFGKETRVDIVGGFQRETETGDSDSDRGSLTETETDKETGRNKWEYK